MPLFKNSSSTESPRTGILSRLGRGLANLLGGQPKPDPALWEELETLLLSADVGIEATQAILKSAADTTRHGDSLQSSLRQAMLEIVQPSEQPLRVVPSTKPVVIMVVGVNGTGKTTTIGKLAHRLCAQGRSVMLAAADTFRAAAVEQLKIWGERNDVPVIAQGQGADAAAVAHDAIQAASARGIEVLIVDTAGRLHTQGNLMDELKKIKRVLARFDADAPHEVLQVLDAGNGQNALTQLEQFHRVVGVTGVCLTKLDGSAKGGILFAVAKKTGLPIRFIGLGEGQDDLHEFDAQAFVDAILPNKA